MARAHVVMSDDVLEEVDERVGERGRSRFVEEAVREKLARLRLEEEIRNTQGIARGKGYEHWRDQRSASAWVRTTRADRPA